MAGKVQTAAGPSGQMRHPAGSGERMEQQMPKKKKKAKRFYDYSLLFCIIFLTAFGLVISSTFLISSDFSWSSSDKSRSNLPFT